MPNLVRKYGNEMFYTSLPDKIFPILETYELDVMNIFSPGAIIRTALSIRYSFP